MRLSILILAAVAAFAQEDKLQVAVSGTVMIGTTSEWKNNDARYLTIDTGQKYSHFALIVRTASHDPIAFCNIKMGRCWDLSVTRRGTLRAYDAISHDGTLYSGTTRLDVHGTASGGVIGIWDEKIKEKK